MLKFLKGLFKKNNSKRERELMREALEYIGIDKEDITDELIDDYVYRDELSVAVGRDHRKYVWYLDGDGQEVCIRVKDGKYISDEEIAKQLA